MEQFQLQICCVTHGINNAAVLHNIFGPDKPDTSTPCFHLIKRVQKKITDSPVKWIGKKVKAHQDDNLSYNKLDSWAKANVAADKLAEEHMTRIIHQLTPCYKRQQGDRWIVSVGDKIVTQQFDKTLMLHCTETKAQGILVWTNGHLY